MHRCYSKEKGAKDGCVGSSTEEGGWLGAEVEG